MSLNDAGGYDGDQADRLAAGEIEDKLAKAHRLELRCRRRAISCRSFLLLSVRQVFPIRAW